MKYPIILSLSVLAGAACLTPALANVEPDGSRTPFVHRITLYDEDGQKIWPASLDANPFSARQTCGQCHHYDVIGAGWHFNAATPGVDPGRPGQPWIHTVPETGIQIPVTSREWPNTWKPEDAGLTPWTMVKEFGRQLPGGGIFETADPAADRESRWEVSGMLEIDCLACHNASFREDMTERAKQIARENLRWSATAASGLGDVGGMAMQMHSTWLPMDEGNPEVGEDYGVPFVRYDLSQVDRKGRVLLDIEHTIPDKRCLFCHSNAHVGEPGTAVDGDIHSVHGMSCSDCHRHGLDHNISRGYVANDGDAKADMPDTSCRGCHYGADENDPSVSGAGRMAAPIPAHVGLPAVHLKKLSCTVCHAGPGPDKGLVQVRTARANRLGVFGVARWDRNVPVIEEPVLMKGQDGKITPHRIVWPAFWARIDGDKVAPIDDAAVAQAADGIIGAPQRGGRLLQALAAAEDAKGVPMIVVKGNAYTVNGDGGLELAGPSTATGDGLSWVWNTNGTHVALLPTIDAKTFPSTNETDEAAVADITVVLKALGTLTTTNRPAVLCAGDKVYHLSIEEELESAARADGATAAQPTLAWKTGARIEPIVSDADVRTIAATVGTTHVLTEENVAAILAALAAGPAKGAKVGYVANGKLFTLGDGDKLTASDNPAAAPCAWPMAHDVRPAAQALGADGDCGDCHGVGSKFFGRKVVAQGPLVTSQGSVKPMAAYMGVSGVYNGLLGLTFGVRPLFKEALGLIAVLLGLVLLAGAVALVATVTRLLGGDKDAATSCFPQVERWAEILGALCILFLACSGFGEKLLFGALGGLPLLAHTSCGALFAAVLAVLVLLRGRAYCFGSLCNSTRFTPVLKVCFWVIIVAGWSAIVSLLLAMVHLLGTHGQHVMLAVHRYSGLLVLIAGVVYFRVARKRD